MTRAEAKSTSGGHLAAAADELEARLRDSDAAIRAAEVELSAKYASVEATLLSGLRLVSGGRTRMDRNAAPSRARARTKGRRRAAGASAAVAGSPALATVAGDDGPPSSADAPPGPPRLGASSVVTIDGRVVTEAELFAAVDRRRAETAGARHAGGRPRGRLTPGSAGAVALAVIAWDAAPGGEFTIADLMRAWEVAPPSRGRCRLRRKRWHAVLASLTRGGWLDRVTGADSRWRIAPNRRGEFPGISEDAGRVTTRAVGC